MSRSRPSGKAGIGVTTGQRAVPGYDASVVMGEAERKAATVYERPSEFSHGPGLVARGFENAAPNEGGRYNPISPPVGAKVGKGLGSAGRRIREH